MTALLKYQTHMKVYKTIAWVSAHDLEDANDAYSCMQVRQH